MATKIILVTWKHNNQVDPFNNLKAFVKHNPGFSYDAINNSLSRQDKPYADDSVHIERKEIIK